MFVLGLCSAGTLHRSRTTPTLGDPRVADHVATVGLDHQATSFLAAGHPTDLHGRALAAPSPESSEHCFDGFYFAAYILQGTGGGALYPRLRSAILTCSSNGVQVRWMVVRLLWMGTERVGGQGAGRFGCLDLPKARRIFVGCSGRLLFVFLGGDSRTEAGQRGLAVAFSSSYSDRQECKDSHGRGLQIALVLYNVRHMRARRLSMDCGPKGCCAM